MLGRWQFGITTVYHFLFVPLSIGLAFLVALMQTIYYRTENEVYDQMTRFFGWLAGDGDRTATLGGLWFTEDGEWSFHLC